MGLLDNLTEFRRRGAQEATADAKRVAENFKGFYKHPFYKEFKSKIEKRLHVLDRSKVVDPQALILMQGERNALIQILDDLNGREAKVNEFLKPE